MALIYKLLSKTHESINSYLLQYEATFLSTPVLPCGGCHGTGQLVLGDT